MPESISDLMDRYEHDSAIHSFPSGMMRSPAFPKLIARGDETVRDVLRRFRDGHSIGMAGVLLLMTITKESPIEPEPVAPGFVGWDVPATLAAWVRWGEERGYLEPAREEG